MAADEERIKYRMSNKEFRIMRFISFGILDSGFDILRFVFHPVR